MGEPMPRFPPHYNKSRMVVILSVSEESLYFFFAAPILLYRRLETNNRRLGTVSSPTGMTERKQSRGVPREAA